MVVLHDALSAMDDWKFHEVIGKVCIAHADRRGFVVWGRWCGGGRCGSSESNYAANFTVAANFTDAANFTNTDSNTVAANFIDAANFTDADSNAVAGNFIDAGNFTNTDSNAVAANNNRAGVRTGAHVRSWPRRRTK